MRGLRNIAFLSGILILCACGFAFLPEPTKKKVVKADLLGVWEYPADYGSTTVTHRVQAGLHLRANHHSSKPRTCSGSRGDLVHCQ